MKKRIISMLLAASMLSGLCPAALAADEPVIWGAERMTEISDLEAENGVIYMGTSAVRAEEHGTYLFTVYRDGNSEEEASIQLDTIDVSATIREDYDVLIDGIEYYDCGGTVMERNANIDAEEKIGEYISSVNEIQTQLAENAPDEETVESELAKRVAEQTGGETRTIRVNGSDMSEGDFLTEMFETYGGSAELSAEEYQANSEALLADTQDNLADYIAVSSMAEVVFAPGETEKQIEIKINKDKKAEDDEIFMLLLSSPRGAELGDLNTATVTIEDDEEKEASYVSFASDKLTLSNGVITLVRTGAEYIMVSVDIVLLSGESKTVYFKPYQTEAEVEFDIDGSGKETIKLENFKGCEAGEITECEVTFGDTETAGKDVNIIKSYTDSMTQKHGIQLFANSSSDANPFYLDGVAPGDVKPNRSAGSPMLEITFDPNKRDEYGNLYAEIIDTSYDGGVHVGNYYFPQNFTTGLFSGDTGKKQFSEWRNDAKSVNDSAPNGYIYLEYYHSYIARKGKSYARITNIPHEKYGYYAVDWENNPYSVYSPGLANGLFKIFANTSNNTSGTWTEQIYKGNKFSRQTTALTSLRNGLPQKTLGKMTVYASDESGGATPWPKIKLYGMAAMFRKFNISLGTVGKLSIRDGINSKHSENPCTVSLATGHNLRYAEQTLTITGTSTRPDDDNLMPGELIGYRILTNNTSVEESERNTFYYMAEGYNPTDADTVKLSSNAGLNIEHTSGDLTNIKFDTDFISIVDKYLKGVHGKGITWTTDLEFTPLYKYKGIKLQVNASKNGSIKDLPVGTYNSNDADAFHLGDTIELLGVPANDVWEFAGVKIVGRATENVNEQPIVNYTVWSTNESEIFMRLGTNNCRFYVIEPVFKEKSGNYISFNRGENSDKITVLNVLTPNQIRTINKNTDYDIAEDAFIYIAEPTATGKTEAETLINMITPVVGKTYKIQAYGQEESGNSYYWAPVYEQQYTFGPNKKVGGYTTYVVASGELSENVIDLSGSRAYHDNDTYLEVRGNVMSMEYTIRQNSEAITDEPVNGMTVYGPGEMSNMWITPRGSSKAVKTLYPEMPQTSTNDDGSFALPGVYIPGVDGDLSYMLYYTNGDIEGLAQVEADSPRTRADITYYRTLTNDDPKAEDYQTNYQVTKKIKGYIQTLKNNITTPVITYGAPYPTSVNYSYANSGNNEQYGNASNSIKIVDDNLTVSTQIALNGHILSKVVFTLATVRGADVEYTVDATRVGQSYFECNFGGKNMKDIFEPGDKLYITLYDTKKKSVQYQLIGDDGEPVLNSAGNPIFEETQYDIVYTRLYTGLSFTVPMTDAVLQSFDMTEAAEMIDVPLVGSVMGSASSGVLSFSNDKWEIDGMEGYTMTFDANATLIGQPSEPAKDALRKVKEMKNEASKKAEEFAKKSTLNIDKDTTNKLKDSIYKRSLSDTFGGNSINLNVIVLLSLEFGYSEQTGSFVFLGGQFAFGGTFGIEHTFYTVVNGVPLFMQLGAEVTAEFEANFREEHNLTSDLFSKTENIAEVMPNDDVGLFLLLSGKMQAGVGICGVLSVRGILQLDIKIYTSFMDINKGSGIMATLYGGLGIDLLIFSFEYVAEIGTIGAGIYEKYTGWGDGTNVASLAAMMDDGAIRTYNMGGGAKVGENNAGVRLMAADEDYTILLDNAPERTRPQIVTMNDGRKFMLYIGSDSDSARDSNKSRLYYSIDNGNGTWTEAKPVDDDATADSTPALAVYGDKVIIVWADASREFTENDDAKTMLSLFDISMAVFDGETLSEPIKVNDDTDARFMDYGPVICADPEGELGAALYYVTKDVNTAASNEALVDPLGTYQTISTKTWDGTTLDDDVSYISINNDSLLMNFDAAMTVIPVNGEDHVFAVWTYVIDNDGNLHNTDDSDVYMQFYDITAKEVYDPINLCGDFLPDMNPQLTRISGSEGETDEIYLSWVKQRNAQVGDTKISELNVLSVNSAASMAASMIEDGEVNADSVTETIKDMAYSDEFGLPVSKVVLSEDNNKEAPLTNYKIMKGEDDNLYLLWTNSGSTDKDDFSIELYGAMKYTAADEEADSGWGKAVKITDFASKAPNTVIDEFATVVDANGNITLLSNMYTQNLEETIRNGHTVYNTVYSQNRLIEFTVDNSEKAEVDGDSIAFAKAYPKAGEETTLEFNINNAGLKKLDGYNAVVRIGGEEFGTVSSDGLLFGGNSETVSVTGIMPANITDDTKIEISVNCNDGNSSDTYIGEIPYGANLEFESAGIERNESGEFIYTVKITNSGNASSGEFMLDISRIKNGEGLVGEITTNSFASIAPGETVTRDITLKPDTLSIFDFGTLGFAELSLRAISGENEIGGAFENVSSRDYAQKITVNGKNSTVTLNVSENDMLTLNVVKTPADDGDSFAYDSADPDTAYVDEHGRLVGVKHGETTITITEVNSGISETFTVTVTESSVIPTAPPESTSQPEHTERPAGSRGGSGSLKPASTPAPTASASPAYTQEPSPDVTAAPSGNSVKWFKDVPQSAWYYNSIKYAYDNGLMVGITDDTFEPETNVTRGMIVTVLHRKDGTPSASKPYTFTDVSKDSYYSDAIAWASENGIVAGYSDTEFGPDDSITREQMTAIMWRYAKYKGIDVSVGENTNILSYTDAEEVSEYAVNAMQWACGAGIINGMDGALVPKGNATRAQTAAILERMNNQEIK
ncbi:MAG: S-layer homology domain-containing protein [Oscillospiraceae bacterium]|nr:S-layer homology domain-containing protein [Oscillospiraceae bacterium]